MKKLYEYLDFDIHDKIINGIKVINDEKLVLYINDDEKIIELYFLKPEIIKLDEFRLGNIIFSIDVYKGNNIKDIEKELLYLLDLNEDEKYNCDYFNKITRDIEIGNILFVELCSSYGLNGFILCKDIKIKSC